MIIPALDIIDNKIVRLYKGDYNLIHYYDYDIYNLLDHYYDAGSNMIHLVDLSAASDPNNAQKQFITQLIRYFKGFIQLAGGIRNLEDIEYFLSIGVKRIVVGSVIIDNFSKFKTWVKKYSNECIVAALDVRINDQNCKTISINGWKKNTTILLEDILKKLSDIDIKYVLCTDISKDGTLLGPNIELYKSLSIQFPKITFQASGGISSLKDIERLLNIGVKDMIIGKSLLEKKFTIAEAIQCYRKGLFPV